jgi:RNA polymerase sigma-70 factor (ECF subfamily)
LAELGLILERCRLGDDLAWEALVRRYQSRVYAVALHYVRDSGEARDLAQEVFIRVYQRMETLEGHETFLPWLLRVARNACIDHLRRRKVRPPSVDVPVEDGPELPDTRANPHDSWVAEDRKRLVYRALEKMSEQDREIILLKEIQGLELKEVAAMLEIPVGTVKSRSYRARIHLAQILLAMNPAYGAGGAV